MSELLQRLTENSLEVQQNWRQIRDEIHNEHEGATTTDSRVALLAMFKTTMDLAEQAIAPEDMEKFKDARLKDYHLLIVREALIGENICTETLDAVTQREIAAGRMAPNDNLHKTALMGMAAPHLSREDLIAINAKKRREEHSPSLSGWRHAVTRIRRSLGLPY